MADLKDTQRESWEAVQEDVAPKQLHVIEQLKRNGPMATFEVSKALGYGDRQGAAPRLHELEEAKVIYDTGERRVNPASGKKNAVYAIAQTTMESFQ